MSSCSSADFPGMPVCEDRQVRGEMRLADRAEHLALGGCDLVPRSNLAKRTGGIVVGLLDQPLNDLLLAHRRDLFRVEGIGVEAGAGDDRQARLHRGLPNEVQIATHVRMAAIDDARDAFAFGGGEFLRHQVHVAHRVGSRWRRWRTAGSSGKRRQAVGRAGCRGRSAELVVEIQRERHVLVEERGASGKLLRRIVLEECSDDGALRKCGSLSERAPRSDGGTSRRHRHTLESVAACDARRTGRHDYCFGSALPTSSRLKPLGSFTKTLRIVSLHSTSSPLRESTRCPAALCLASTSPM